MLTGITSLLDYSVLWSGKAADGFIERMSDLAGNDKMARITEIGILDSKSEDTFSRKMSRSWPGLTK